MSDVQDFIDNIEECRECGAGYEIQERRNDGTFVILYEDQPYHVTPEYCPELYAAVCAQEGIEVPHDPADAD